MRPIKERRRSRSSPARDRPIGPSGFEPRPSGSRSTRLSPSSTSLLDTPFTTEEEDATLFEKLKISPNPNFNPRSFPYSVKQQCWEKAEKIKGRDPERWRRDALGNIVFRKLVGCPGCLCHDYDHIVPYSKGARAHWKIVRFYRWFLPDPSLRIDACFSLNWKIRGSLCNATVNRSKGNRTEISKADLIQKSSYCRVSGRDMDLLELSAYGNVRRGQDSGGCTIQ